MSKITLKLKRPSAASAEPPTSNGSSLSDDELLVGHPSIYEDEEPSLLPCEWGDCKQAFWEVEGLMAHIHQHVDAHPKSCQWEGCRFKGKAQSNKSSLVAHMRSHSGEKLHWCRLPECDKVFSRTDALNKHERSVHTGSSSANAKASTSKTDAPASNSKKRRASSPAPQSEGLGAMGAGDSDLSDLDEPSQKKMKDEARPSDQVNGNVMGEAPPLDDSEVAAALEAHPQDDPDQIRCIVMLAKLNHIQKEQAGLRAEREAVVASRDQLWSEKEELVNQICAEELQPNWQDSLGPKDGQPAKWSFTTRSTLL